MDTNKIILLAGAIFMAALTWYYGKIKPRNIPMFKLNHDQFQKFVKKNFLARMYLVAVVVIFYVVSFNEDKIDAYLAPYATATFLILGLLMVYKFELIKKFGFPLLPMFFSIDAVYIKSNWSLNNKDESQVFVFQLALMLFFKCLLLAYRDQEKAESESQR